MKTMIKPLLTICVALLFHQQQLLAQLVNAPQSKDTLVSDVYTMPEKMPEFDGDLMAFLGKSLNYPAKARESGIQGRVIVQFIVMQDGSIDSLNILKSPDESLSVEVLRVVRLMPKWKPGMQDGAPVNVRFTLPVVFKLDDNTKKKK